MAYTLFGSFMALILLRVPISIAIGVAALVTFVTSDFSTNLQIIPQQMLEGVNKASLTAVPFFIMAGNLMNVTGVTERIFAFANALVGHLRAGLAQVNILSSMIFAGISGAAVADCAGLGAIEIKAMRERGYKPDFAAAITVASSVIGPLIPPSIGLVLYAFLAQQSIERMFLAGLIPGIVVGLALMTYVRIIAQFRDFPTQPRATAKEVAGTAKHGFLALLAPAIILGTIMFGFVTATEAGVLACLYCIILGVWYRELTMEKFLPKSRIVVRRLLKIPEGMCDVSDMSVISRVPASKQGVVRQKQMMTFRHAGGARGGVSAVDCKTMHLKRLTPPDMLVNFKKV